MNHVIDKTDGRNVDPRLGILGGEAATVRVNRPETAKPYDADEVVTTGEPETYYGLPVLQEPVWKLYIPIYFWAGGSAGAAAALGAAAQLVGGRGHRRLIRRCRWIAAGGTAAGAVLLIADLGRPTRFLNMLRVFRPSSPMNVGTWILSAASAASAASAVLPGRLGDAAGLVAGLCGLPLAGYTGVLLANTAVPIWTGAPALIPPLFVASAAASGASLLEIGHHSPRARRTVGIFAAAAKALELATAHRLEGALEPRVARPLREGPTGAIWRAGKILGVAGLACSVLSMIRGGRRWSTAAGIFGALGGLAVKLAFTEAGKPSARDPHATFGPQRGRP